MNYKYATTLSLLSFLALTALHGADVPLVRGQIQTPKPELLQGLYAGLEEVVTRTQIHRVDIHGDGAFEFRGVPSGDYLLRVTDLHGDTVYQQFVTIQEHFSEIQVSLPDSGRTPVHPGKVSLTQLMHPPDKKAVQAFHTALRRMAGGDRRVRGRAGGGRAGRPYPANGGAHRTRDVDGRLPGLGRRSLERSGREPGGGLPAARVWPARAWIAERPLTSLSAGIRWSHRPSRRRARLAREPRHDG